MNVLLDTHVFLWASSSSGRLSAAAREAIADTSTICFLSDASVFEIAVKVATGRLVLGAELEFFVADMENRLGLSRLRVERSHLARLATLPLHHRDPFDRLLVSQSTVERLSLITSDQALARYGVALIW